MSASFGDFLRQHIGKLLSPLVNGFGGFLAKIVLIVAIRVGRCFDAVCESVAHLVPPGSVAGSHRIFGRGRGPHLSFSRFEFASESYRKIDGVHPLRGNLPAPRDTTMISTR